jgi:soluble cytochrome b562
MRQYLDYPIDLIAILCLIAVVVAQLLMSARRRAQAETLCLMVAADAHRDFFRHAEIVLESDSAPAVMKGVLVHLMDAMSDETEGRKALEELVKLIDQDETSSSAPSNELKEFRERFPDLHETFSVALRAAMSGLLTAYGPHHRRIVLEYRATLDQSVTYALAKRIGDILDGLAGERRLPRYS